MEAMEMDVEDGEENARVVVDRSQQVMRSQLLCFSGECRERRNFSALAAQPLPASAETLKVAERIVDVRFLYVTKRGNSFFSYLLTEMLG